MDQERQDKSGSEPRHIPRSDETQPYEIAPAEPVPVGPGKIDEKPLLEDFDEDADFSHDPEVDRALKGEPPKQEVKADEPKPVAPLVKEGMGDAASVAMVSAGVLLAAVIVACINAQGSWFKAGVAATYLTVLNTATGVLAVGLESFLKQQPFGKLDLAAARMLGAVSIFQLLVHLNLPIPGRFDEPVVASAGYFVAVLLLFRFPIRTAFHVGIFHAVFWLSVWAIMTLHAWATAVPIPPAK